MSKVIKNIFMIIFFGVLAFNFIVVAFTYNGSGWINGSLTDYFVPTRENFIGLEVWFDKISTYPGLKNLLANVQAGVQTASETPVISAIIYIYLPFTMVWNLILDILNNLIWFFSLLDPYHVFIGF